MLDSENLFRVFFYFWGISELCYEKVTEFCEIIQQLPATVLHQIKDDNFLRVRIIAIWYLRKSFKTDQWKISWKIFLDCHFYFD